MRIALMNNEPKDISNLITSVTWSGDKTQVARKLEFTLVQDTRDPNIPVVELASGNRVYGGDDDGNPVFIGKIYEIEKGRANGDVHIICYDNLFILNKSKTSHKYSNALPENIAQEICKEMGITAGNIAKTGVQVSFIANDKTGYQIIQGAYTEAHKKNEKHYQCIMNGESLDVIEKGTLIEDFALDSSANMLDSNYKESIENIVNQVLVVDDSGNGTDTIKDEESQNDYGIAIQDVYKVEKGKDTAEEAKDRFKKVEREGNVTALGDYRIIHGYSIVIKDALFTGSFWIKSDTHTFKGGFHEMKLTLEFLNLMDEVEVEHEKPQKSTSNKNKSGRKRKDDNTTESK